MDKYGLIQIKISNVKFWEKCELATINTQSLNDSDHHTNTLLVQRFRNGFLNDNNLHTYSGKLTITYLKVAFKIPNEYHLSPEDTVIIKNVTHTHTHTPPSQHTYTHTHKTHYHTKIKNTQTSMNAPEFKNKLLMHSIDSLVYKQYLTYYYL